MKLRVLASLLCIFMLFPIFTACGEKSEVNTTDSSTEPESQLPTEPEKILPNLPAANFEGHEFKVLSRIIPNADWIDWIPRDVYAEEENSEPINDAVYKRNRYVEEKYNCVVKEVTSEQFDADLRKIIKASDDTYDLVCPGLQSSATFAQEGLFYDLKTVANMDLSKPWYNQLAVSGLSIGGKLYFVQGALSILDNDAQSAMIFNKQLIKDLALDDPYQLVKSKKWTMDKMYEMAKLAAADLDNDGAMGVDDRWGLMCQIDATISFIHGSGLKLGDKDAQDLPFYTFRSEKMMSVCEKVFDFMCDPNVSINLHAYENKFPVYEYQTKVIQENRTLFSWIRMRVVETLRNMDTDFGIIPTPLFDETQSDYWSTENVHTSCALAIPVSTADPARAGFIFEALSAESLYTLEPAYYEVQLQGKFIRDEESKEMLDIILSHQVYDVAEVYNFGGFSFSLMNLTRTNKKTYVSEYEKNEGKIEKDIQKCIDNFAKLP